MCDRCSASLSLSLLPPDVAGQSVLVMICVFVCYWLPGIDLAIQNTTVC